MAVSIAHFVTAATQNFHVLPTKKCLLWFFISCPKFLSPFFSLSFAGLPPTFSFSLTISDNFHFPFSSLLTLLLSLLYKTPVAMRFPGKITSSCNSVAIPVDWVILHCYACGADGRSLGRAVYGHVITKFSRRVDYFIFLPMVLCWRASCTRAALKKWATSSIFS